VLLVLLVLSLSPAAIAGNPPQPLHLSFETIGGGPPDVEVLADGTIVFKASPVEGVSGDLTGTLTEHLTQVYNAAEEDGVLPIATIWELVTSSGSMKGYYAGTFVHLQDGTHRIVQVGEVLSVTGAYAELYQAKVVYKGSLNASHMFAEGRITILPRRKHRQ
jgi:hypothetical protein